MHDKLLLPAVAKSGAPLLDVVHTCDAYELLASLPDKSVDAVITDPPYGLYGNVVIVRPDTGSLYKRVNETWDKTAPVEWMTQCERILKPGGSVICFGGRQSIYLLAAKGIQLGWRLINDITWEKPDATPNFSGRLMTESTERILWFCPSGMNWTYNLKYARKVNRGQNLRDVWTFGVERNRYGHPTQKPLGLLERVMGLITQPGDLIVDPFVGSGTTAVAARNLGRHYICGDQSAEYVAIANKRLAQPYTLPLFTEDTPAPKPEAVTMSLWSSQ